MGGALTDLSAVFGRWRTWLLMANQDIQMRYRRSLLGPFWISLSMAFLVTGMAFLYGKIFNQQFHEYLYWLACSFLVWFLIQALIAEGLQIAIEAESQLRSIHIPLPVLAARMVYRNLIVFLHNLLVIVILTALFGLQPKLVMLVAIPGLLVVATFGFFCSLVLGPICLRFRDVAQVVMNLLQIAFFLTPIIWKPDQGRIPTVFIQGNPLFHFIELIRAPILGRAPTLANWEVSLGALAAAFVLALLTLGVARRKVFVWL
jgi:ABC-type polysaccharide/polyol phosphate export permease